MSIGFMNENHVNGRYISQYYNEKTGREMVFIDGIAVEKTFLAVCMDLKQKQRKRHEIKT